MADTKKAISDTNSPAASYDDRLKSYGGLPPEKDVKEVDKVNSPSGRKPAPGSVRQ